VVFRQYVAQPVEIGASPGKGKAPRQVSGKLRSGLFGIAAYWKKLVTLDSTHSSGEVIGIILPGRKQKLDVLSRIP
jgi:hypothetical protein